MFSKGNVLTLGVSLCSVVLVYLYVKNRINNVESKVDRLIEVIQLYDQRSQLAQMQMGGNTGQKIVVSDAEDHEEGSESEEEGSESEEEGSESEEEHDDMDEETTQTLTLESGDSEGAEIGVFMQGSLVLQHDDLSARDIKGEVGNLHEVSPDIKEVDGLDDMDDLEEESDDDEEENETLEVEEVVDFSKMGKLELKKLCEDKGFDIKGKKKYELIALLK
jgi:hypothetical protein